MSWTAGGPRSDREERGVTPLVGIILLFGMVFAGAALLFIAGSALIDATETDTELETIRSAMDMNDRSIRTVAETGEEQVLGLEAGSGASFSPDGSIELVWYNASEQGQIPWDDEDHEPCSASVDELGTIEYEAGDRTVAYQGGGVFERTSSDTFVRSPPGVGFDDDRLQLSVMKIDWSHDGGDAVAQKNLTASRAAVEELSGASRDCEMDTDPSDPQDLALRIESEYAAGWERHLENEAELTDRDVEVDRDGDVVTMEAMGLGDTPDPATFRISEDLGSPDYPDPNDVRVTFPSESPAPHPLNWTAEFNNTGDESIDRDVTFEILGEGIEDTERLELGPGKSEVQEFQIPPDHYEGLSPGQEYEYDIYVENDEDSLDTYGSFYYGKEGTHFDVVDIVEPDGDEVAIGARLQNLGVENGTEEATIQIHHETGGEIVSSDRDLTLEYGRDATITWNISESEWPNDEYEFSVTTESDEEGKSGEFEITEGYDAGLVVTEDRGIAGGEQVVTEDEDVVVEAEINNTGFEDLEGPVTLELFEQDGDDGLINVSKDISVDGSDTERVELTVADPGLEAGEIYEYDVTADDGLDDRGSFLVVEEREIPEFSIEDVALDDPVKPGSSLEVTVDLENAGDAGEELVWLEGFDGDAVAVEEVELEDEEETITLVWEDVAVPDPIDETTVTVRTAGDEESAEVDVEPLLEVENVTVLDDPVEPGDTATIEADLESIAGDATREVVLKGTDGSQVDSAQVTDGDPETVELEYDTASDVITDRITVETDDDEMEEVLVVARDGPDCSEVSYEGGGTSDDPYQIQNVDQLQCIEDHDLEAHYELVDDIDAHGTQYWNPVNTTTEEKTGSSGNIEQGEQFELSETPVVEGSVEATDGAEVEVIDADEGIIEVTDCPWWGCGSQMDVTYEYVTETGDPRGFEPIGDGGHDWLEGPTRCDRPCDWEGQLFSGTLEGNGNVIEGLTIQRPNERFVGLFGSTSLPHLEDEQGFETIDVGEGSEIRNVRLADVDVHGERYVGALAGQAGGTINQSRSEGTVRAEEQLVGGLVGAGAHAELDNELVAEGKVSGGENVEGFLGEGIGGLVGRTHWGSTLSVGYTQDIDVEFTGSGNANAGGVLGATSYVDSEFDQMYTNVSVESDQGGSIVGAILQQDGETGDVFTSAVYWDRTEQEDGDGRQEGSGTTPTPTLDWNDRTTAEMIGLDATEPGNMGNLDYEEDGGPWVAIPDDYPRFAWELAAEGAFEVEIDDVGEDVTAGEFVEVDVTVTSRYADRDETNVTQTIALENPDGETVDTRSVELPSTLEVDEEETITLVWRTSTDDDGDDRELTVRSEDAKDTALVDVDDLEIGPGSSDSDREFELGDGEDEFGEVPNVGTGEASDDDGPESEPDVDIDGSTIVID